MITVCFINQKGGVAKTTSAAACAEVWARQGHRVLAVDMDPQGSLGVRFGVLDASERGTAYDVLAPKNRGEYPIDHEDILVHSGCGVDIVPADVMLAGLDRELANAMDKNYRLVDALEDLERRKPDAYEVCVIDCPPSLGICTELSLVAADYVVIPTSAGLDSLRGIRQLNDTIADVRNPRVNPDLKIAGVIVTMYERQLKVHQEHMAVINDMAQALGTLVLEPPVRKAVAVEKALDNQSTVINCFPKEGVTQDYYALAGNIAREIGLEG